MADKKSTGGSGRYSPEIERLQREAQADGFPITVDGFDGPETKAALEKYRVQKQEKMRRDAEQATASQAAAAKEAEARAETERTRAEALKAEASIKKAEADRVEAERKEREDREKREYEAREAGIKAERDATAAKVKAEREATERNIKTGLTVAFPVAGALLGHKIASGITKADHASIEARKANLATIAKETDKAAKSFVAAKGAAKTALKKQLLGSVAAADKLQLTRTKGPLGWQIAGLFLVEGAFSRFVAAPQVDNPIAKEALLQVSSASFFAASSLMGERAIANRTPTVQPAAKDLASIERARTLTAPAGKAAQTVTGNVYKQALQATAPTKATEAALKKAGGSFFGRLLPAVSVVAAVAAIATAAKAGGAKEAIKTAAQIVDPTNGAAGRAIEAVAGGNDSPLKAMAKEQAAARAAAVPSIITVSEVIARDMAAGAMHNGQGELMSRVANSGLDNYYAGARPEVFERRAPVQEMAGQAAREANGRVAADPKMDAVPTPPPQVPVASGGPRGFQNEKNQIAAQLAKRALGQ